MKKSAHARAQKKKKIKELNAPDDTPMSEWKRQERESFDMGPRGANGDYGP